MKYKIKTPNDPKIEELQSILSFSQPIFKKLEFKGKVIKNDFYSKSTIEPFGIIPLYQKEGYLFITVEGVKEMPVFRYDARILKGNPKQTAVKLSFVQVFRKRASQKLVALKKELLKKYQELPQPLTFNLHLSKKYPLHSTVLPSGERLIAEYLLR